jgi:hypothetical protein
VQGVAPNPFSGGARIQYLLGAPANARAKTYEVVGRLVQTHVEGIGPVGSLGLDQDGWNDFGDLVGSGIYLL